MPFLLPTNSVKALSENR